MQRVVIAGAGVIGLATALELAGRGYRVTVFERGKALREASWAAAGMLAAGDPENAPGLAEFARFSRDLYPAFLQRLKDLTGIPVPTRTTHTLQLVEGAYTRGDVEAESVLSHEEAMRRIPGLQVGIGWRALWLEEQSLDPRDLCRALRAAVDAAGIELIEDTPVLSSCRGSERASMLHVITQGGTIEADTLVVTTGAWGAAGVSDTDLHTLPAGWVEPRKGQMLRVRQPEDTLLTTVLRSPSIYIVPRGNGSLVVGATVEDAGFDRTIHEDATEWLLREAAQMWWPIAGVTREQIEEVWTGIRPATADALPILGSLKRDDDGPKVIFATGHYRNGILLAPGTARLVGALVSDEEVEIDITLFSPRRMMPSSEVDASNPCSHDKETSAAL
jgi:glycine oxidase